MSFFRRDDLSKDSTHQASPVELQENGQGQMQGANGNTDNPQFPSRFATFMSRFADGILPQMRIPMSFIVGGGIMGVAIWALVKRVQGLIAHASVGTRPETWLQKARIDYENCYNGCSDCRDLNFAFNAYQKTSQVILIDTICDGNKMWNWAEQYPESCLEELGGRYKTSALAELKQSYRNQLVIVVLTILAGIAGFAVIYSVWPCIVSRVQRHFPRNPHPNELPSSPPPPYQNVQRRGGNLPFFTKATVVAGLGSIVGGANAFHAGDIAKRPIATSSTRMEQYQESYIARRLTAIPSATFVVKLARGRPMAMEAALIIASKIGACGFTKLIINGVSNHPSLRIGNPLLEKNRWVKISVDRYNTTADVTDPSVLCLWEIGNN